MTEGWTSSCQARWKEEPRSAKPREGMRVLQVPEGSQASEFPADHTGVWVQTGPASSLGAWPSHPPSLSVLAAADCITREADSRVKPTSWELQDAARVSLAPPKQNKHPPALSAEQQEAGRPRRFPLHGLLPWQVATLPAAGQGLGKKTAIQSDPVPPSGGLERRPCSQELKQGILPIAVPRRHPGPPMQPFPILTLQTLKSYLGANTSPALCHLLHTFQGFPST